MRRDKDEIEFRKYRNNFNPPAYMRRDGDNTEKMRWLIISIHPPT